MSFLVTAEDLHPFAESEVGGDDHAASLVALGEQVEEQLAASAIEGHEAELVEHEKLDVLQTTMKPTELVCITGFEQRADAVSGSSEEHAAALASRFDAECDRAASFAGAEGACEDYVVGA